MSFLTAKCQKNILEGAVKLLDTRMLVQYFWMKKVKTGDIFSSSSRGLESTFMGKRLES